MRAEMLGFLFEVDEMPSGIAANLRGRSDAQACAGAVDHNDVRALHGRGGGRESRHAKRPRGEVALLVDKG
jgi:hypothetical protein